MGDNYRPFPHHAVICVLIKVRLRVAKVSLLLTCFPVTFDLGQAN